LPGWYLAVNVDALEWVVMPNMLGMAVFADGGRMASKPYAASGGYINRMSDFCGGCGYDIDQKTGPPADPFNYLYWAFLIRHRPPGDMPSGGWSVSRGAGWRAVGKPQGSII